MAKLPPTNWDHKAHVTLLLSAMEVLTPTTREWSRIVKNVRGQGYRYSSSAAQQHLQKLRRKEEGGANVKAGKPSPAVANSSGGTQKAGAKGSKNKLDDSPSDDSEHWGDEEAEDDDCIPAPKKKAKAGGPSVPIGVKQAKEESSDEDDCIPAPSKLGRLGLSSAFAVKKEESDDDCIPGPMKKTNLGGNAVAGAKKAPTVITLDSSSDDCIPAPSKKPTLAGAKRTRAAAAADSSTDDCIPASSKKAKLRGLSSTYDDASYKPFMPPASDDDCIPGPTKKARFGRFSAPEAVNAEPGTIKKEPREVKESGASGYGTGKFSGGAV